ncbi:MAG: hypothetical protein AUJ74_02000 [Candidatus Omnitrophica bacterium CG1_02_44_16]|nr:MAG: hypothetical protein AUJ74_02000 [Candidatus Omnitrophica bacterium CG1_02_44_16]PIY83465.1 MAG: hypothetical protein COY78_01925 [Candidatus Omnitrophica bacterium CG_4_10_14_0_8_um_filter_44_12]PIZ84934.1 MAG: hypothetical protein COX96_01245 [Candidatus Omnitrophica bacterium CG_4_10_14_0_2_um_filter_44_9]
MSKPRQARKTNKKGQALILSYIVILVLLVYSAGLWTKAISEKGITERDQLTAQAFYMAEGANEYAISAFSSAVANFVIPSNIATYNVTTIFTTFGNTTVDTTITRLEAADRLIVEGSTNIYAANYEVISTATHPQNSSIIITVHQIIARRLIPTFQHAVFYDQDLEMLPGPNMTITGRIHSNQDIYMDSSGNTLTVDSTYLHSAGDIFNKRKDASGPPAGTVSIRIDQGGPPTFANMDGLDSSSPTWPTDSTTRWKGTVQSSVHGVTRLTAPAVGSIQPGGYYATQANVSVVNNIIYKGGTALVEGTDYPTGTIATTTSSFYSNREGKFIKMTTLDLNKLAGKTGTCGAGSCPNNMPDNGLLYATRNDISGIQEPGIKLINGSEIARAGGLTVVSNDPVYVKGDYNTVSEQPTSIIADSLNLLSNNWNDTNSTSSLSSRPATATTFNSAFVAGIDNTTTGNYNGGLENYPRLHENWTGRNLTIKGSFVALWNSSVANGGWTYGNPQYTAPNRIWAYNTAFNDPANLPPFTPWAVEAQRIAWWSDLG